MIRFDYLHDPPPRFLGALRTARLPRRFHNAAVAALGVLVLCAGAEAIERQRVHEAERVRAQAQARFERSRIALQRLRLEWQRMDALIAEDRRLRDIRLSGSVVAGRLAMLGNLLPGTASVDSVRATADGFSIKGKALTIDAVGSALSRIIAENALPHPGAVRIAKDAGFFAGFSFEVGAGVVP